MDDKLNKVKEALELCQGSPIEATPNIPPIITRGIQESAALLLKCLVEYEREEQLVKNAPTCELVRELKGREGVETWNIDPHKPPSSLMLDNLRTSTGPAMILIVTD